MDIKQIVISISCFTASLSQVAHGHDTWVETGSSRVLSGQYVYVDLRLGNHGNEHRDFKLNSKVTLAPCTLTVRTPSGSIVDLKPRIIDLGLLEKEGYWSARYEPIEPGLHEIYHELEMLKGRMRVLKTAKTLLLCEPKQTAQGAVSKEASSPPASQVESKLLEWHLKTPWSAVQAGQRVQLQLLHQSKPLANVTIAIIPRGVQLAAGVDPEYQITTDSQGQIDFTPATGNLYLLVAHYRAENESGENYDLTHYGATMVLAVPN